MPLLRDIAINLLTSDIEIELPSCPDNFAEQATEYTARKVVWWILKNREDPAEKHVLNLELPDEDEAESNQITPDHQRPSAYDELDHLRAESDTDSVTTASNGRKNKRSKIYIKEFLGLGTLKAKIRKPSCNSVNSDDNFINVFECDSECDYFNGNAAGTCVPCNKRVVGNHQLEEHLSSASHRNSFRSFTSLDVRNNNSLQDENSEENYVILAKLKVLSPEESVNIPLATNKCTISISPEERLAVLRKINIGDYDIPTDHTQNDTKLRLRYAQKWSSVLDKKWNQTKKQEQIIIDEFKALRTSYLEKPSSHPAHRKEWLLFWETRRSQLIKQGRNPDTHNYHPEWCDYWLPKMLELLRNDAVKKIYKLKVANGMDAESLKHLLDSPTPITGTVRVMPGTQPYYSQNRSRNPNRVQRPSSSSSHRYPGHYGNLPSPSSPPYPSSYYPTSSNANYSYSSRRTAGKSTYERRPYDKF
ncbi:uncharacterized protein LOC110843799 isoform X2 [Folsomia candida]|uniref:uncharacterized protein LOC110843799 isoform X2 n=1 Tax=Folsomia candida TaxID=158441 RepID=UPI000B8FC032|nr:uncharacterized protein LOC110843799 isoform X2 [Folsomia candida]